MCVDIKVNLYEAEEGQELFLFSSDNVLSSDGQNKNTKPSSSLKVETKNREG